MDGKLLSKGLIRFGCGVAALALLLFPAAGNWRWPEGWRLMAALFVPMLGAGFVLIFKDPELLRRRLNAKETEPEQKRVIALSGAMFAAAFVLAGLNERFGWLRLGDWVSWVGVACFLAAYALYAEVLRENTWLSRTVEVSEGQTVVDTGLYGVVRHPMYAVTLMLFLSMPLVLGSLISLLVMLFYPVLIVRRILNEEEVLRRELKGYEAYTRKVRWRLIPGIW